MNWNGQRVMLKFILMPFVAIFLILRAIFLPWYLRWIFRLNWKIYVGLALGAGYFAYTEFEDYRFNMLEAEQRVQEDPPALTPLSQWTTADIGNYNEVNVAGLYFSALPQGEFDRIGGTQGFIMLADDLGREVKAILAVRPDDLGRLRSQMAAQGNGDRVAVVVGGILNRTAEWDGAIRTELLALNLPAAQNLVVIEPFVGRRADAIYRKAERTIGPVWVFGALAGLLAALGLGKRAIEMGERTSLATQSKRPARGLQDAKKTKTPTQKAMPNSGNEAAPSPWGVSDAQAFGATFRPQTAKSKELPKPIKTEVTPPIPAFKSTFPGGGSGFRFKSADEIIRQSFGTLSALKTTKRDD